MLKFKNIDFYDFNFNDYNLSDFGGYVGSSSGGFKSYSVLPSRNYVTDRPLGSDTTTVFYSSLEPRVFEVPVVFEQLDDGTLRNIASWLNSPTASKFQWVGDTVYINACLDSQDFNAQSSSGQDGQLSLKFICFDPYYYDVEAKRYTQTNLVSGKVYTYENNGATELDPYIILSCNGDIKFEVLDKDGNVKTTTEITNITCGIKIDSKLLECSLISGASHFAYLTGDFPIIPMGEFKVRVSGDNLETMNLGYRQKYL